NNHIYNFGRVFRTYSPAISMYGVGNRLSHNYIHDSPHAGVLFGGNEHILEFNEIHDIAKETGDVGAFYIGRNWTCRGTIIRYNYFHHLFGPGLHGVRAVYLDDFSSGTTIFGNVFYQAGRAAFIGGGRDNIIENNIFIECDPSIQVDARGLGWAKHYFDKSSKLYLSTLFDGMDAVNFSQPPYSEKYPELLTLYDDDPAIPKNNKIVRNVSFGGRFIDLYDKLDFEIVEVKDNLIGDPVLLRESLETDQSDNFQTFKYGHVETMEKMKGNIFLQENPGFEDIAKEKFQLNDDSPAYELGFKKIPVKKIGLYSDEYRTHLPDGSQ
ncbi:MAG: right-handed parallel beta-helix repeat-containing protein, partial [Bacteroidales bacterium]|nr:right-handed parallel beta-helix repeat-containing protein [Bacteroidales bacterium]